MNRTYRKLFNQRPAITSLGDFKFPQGIKISLDGMIAFAICLIPGALLSPVAHAILGMNRVVAMLALACGGAFLATRVDLMGKPFPVFVLNLAAYFFRAHHTNGWDSIKAAGRTDGSLSIDVSWTHSYGRETAVGSLPVIVQSMDGQPSEIRVEVPVDVRALDGRRFLVKRSIPSTKAKSGRKLTTGLQPGHVTLSKDGVGWRGADAVPQFANTKRAKSANSAQIRF